MGAAATRGLRNCIMHIPGLIVGLVAVACSQTAPVPSRQPQFTIPERDAVLQYWNEPGRYKAGPPKDYPAKGLWQVRLTTAGSQWLWALYRSKGVKMIPTQDAKGQTEQQKLWDAWIDAKVSRDRWIAGQVAAEANALVMAKPPTGPRDTFVPATEPPDPGPIPVDLVATAGDPPIFAEAVVPTSHTISFDDGTTLTYTDNVRMRPKYAYYRFDRGVNSEGVPVKSLPPEEIDKLCAKAGVTPSEARVMKAVSMLEGGFDSINTYDTGYVSVGFIQFATLKDGGNSLGKMLLSYKTEQPELFQRDFRRYGIDVTPDAILDILDPGTGAELTGAEATRKIIDDKRLIAVFGHAGTKSEDFNAQQIKAAKAQFYPADDVVDLGGGLLSLTGKVSDFIHSEAGMATLMDRKVNTGKLDPLIPVLQQIATEYNVKDFADFATYEYQIIAAMKYRRNYLEDPNLSQPPGSQRDQSRASRSGTRGGRKGGGGR